MVGPVLAMDAHGGLNLAALALDPDRSRASLAIYRSAMGDSLDRARGGAGGAAECCYSIVTDLNPSVPIAETSMSPRIWAIACALHVRSAESWSGQGRARPGPLFPGLCFNPEVLVDKYGTVHVIWMTGPSAAAFWRWIPRMAEIVQRARNGGRGDRRGPGRFPETAPATCIADDGVALCVWADDREGRARIYRRRSLDGGRTWQGPVAGEPLVRDTSPANTSFSRT